MIDITVIIKAKIETILSLEDFTKAISDYSCSESKQKNEAIRLLQEAFPLYCNTTPKSVLTAQKQLTESMADYSDMSD